MLTTILDSVQKYLSTKYRQIKRIIQKPPFIIPVVFLPLPIIVFVIFIIMPALSYYSLQDDKEMESENKQYKQLLIDQSFFTAQIAKAKTDSIGLTIDLVDSTVILDLKGVPLRICRLKSYSLQLYNFTQTDSIAAFLKKPFTLRNFWASTAKIPIVEKMAPKDTIEANQQLMEPISPPQDDIYAYLEYNNKILLYISQVESPSRDGWWNKLEAQLKYFTKEIDRSFSSLLDGKPIQILNQIEIELPQEDVRAIYRALPKNGLMTLRISA